MVWLFSPLGSTDVLGVGGGDLCTLGLFAKGLLLLVALSASDAKYSTSLALQSLDDDAREPARALPTAGTEDPSPCTVLQDPIRPSIMVFVFGVSFPYRF